MLTKTLRKNIKTIKKYEKGLKTQYGSLIQERYDGLEHSANRVIMQDELDQMFDEICIVEDPTQVVVEFPIVSDVQLDEKLPFFKSITYKLEKIFN